MIFLLLTRHPDISNSVPIIMSNIRRDRQFDYRNCYDYDRSIDFVHPEEQVTKVEEIINKCNYPAGVLTEGSNAIIYTHSLLVIHLLNNKIIKDPNFNIEAYEVIPANKKKLAKLKSAFKDGLIDESILSHVYDSIKKSNKN